MDTLVVFGLRFTGWAQKVMVVAGASEGEGVFHLPKTIQDSWPAKDVGQVERHWKEQRVQAGDRNEEGNERDLRWPDVF